MAAEPVIGRGWCRTDERWMAVVTSPLRRRDQVPHLLATLFTGGLWLRGWLLLWLRVRKPVCATCGTTIWDQPTPIPPGDLRRVHRLGQNVLVGAG